MHLLYTIKQSKQRINKVSTCFRVEFAEKRKLSLTSLGINREMTFLDLVALFYSWTATTASSFEEKPRNHESGGIKYTVSFLIFGVTTANSSSRLLEKQDVFSHQSVSIKCGHCFG